MLSLLVFIIIIITDASIRLFPSPYWNGMYPTGNMWKISFQISRISPENQCTFGKGLRILARAWSSWFTPGVKVLTSACYLAQPFKHFYLNKNSSHSWRAVGTFLIWLSRRRRWHPTPVPLPGKSHGWRSLVGCSPWGC